MKKFIKKLALAVVALLTFSVGSNYTVKEVKAAEQSATLSFADKTQRTSFSSTQQIWEQNGITFTNKKASSTNAVADYAKPVRLYQNSSVNVSFADYNITKIVFDANSPSYATAMKNSIGSAATAASDKVTVTLDGTSNSFDVAKLTAQVRLDSITVTYVVPDGTPAISISGSNYTQIGEAITLTESHENVEGTVVWSSSDETVATVIDGVVTPVSIGKATITASIMETNATKEITVYPVANSELTIAEALKVCSLTGTPDAPYVYSVTGTIKTINEAYSSQYKNITVTITDDTNSIKAFRMKGGEELVVGDNITVTGYLCTYGSTPEFNSGCTYVLNESETIKNIRAELNEIKTYMSLAYEYSSKTESVEVETSPVKNVTDTLDRALTGITGTNYASWSGKIDSSSAVYAGQSAGGNESIQLRSNNSNSGIVTTTSGGVARKITVVWNSNTSNGRVLNVYGSHEAYTAPTQLYNTVVGDKIGAITCGTSTELVITGNYEYIGLRSNSGAMYINSISIEWEFEEESSGETITKDVTTFSSSNFFIRCGADVALADIENIDSYGVKVSTSNNEVHYYSTSEAWGAELNTDPQYCYVVINLGDIINDVAKLTTKFTVEAFVKVGEEIYYSNNETTYSVVDMIKVYKEKNIEAVNHLYNYFVEQKLIVEEAN